MNIMIKLEISDISYSVKLGYHALHSEDRDMGLSAINGNTKWWKCKWHLCIPNKVKLFLWCYFHDLSPSFTKELGEKGDLGMGVCSRFGKAVKTLFMLLFFVFFSRSV